MTITKLNNQLLKLQKQFVIVESKYEATEDMKFYYLLDEINIKMSALSNQIESLENNLKTK